MALWVSEGAPAAQNIAVRISAKADYAIRAAIFLAAASSSGPLKAEAIARSQEIPLKFLLNILSYAKARAGILKEFTGVSDPYEEPTDAELIIDTTAVTQAEAAQQII